MNLLITGAWAQAQEHIPQIEQMGHTVRFLQQEKDPLPCAPDWVEGIICNGLFLHHSIESFPNLRYIQLTSAGFDRVPMNYVQSRGIVIHNARGVYSIPMAEFAIAGILSLYKKLDKFRDNQRVHRWEKDRGLMELAGQTVVIVGCGSVGTECAKRFKAFECRVLGVDVSVREDPHYDGMLPIEELDNVLAKADIVVLTVPLTEETRHMVDASKLSVFHGVLVNIARGAVVDEHALAEWNGTAILDVFEDEPLCKDSFLWDVAHYMITPHNSFIGGGNNLRLSHLIMGNLLQRGN